MSATPQMTLVLNQAEALIDCKAATLKELAQHLGKRDQQVVEWVRRRHYVPNGEIAMGIFHWVSAITLRVSAGGRPWQKKYSRAFDSISNKHPVNGKREGIEI